MTLLYRLRALVRSLFRRDKIEHMLDSDLADYAGLFRPAGRSPRNWTHLRA